MAKVELPNLRVGRRVRFMYGGTEWLGIVMCCGEKRKYVVNGVPYYMLPSDISDTHPEIFRHIVSVTETWLQVHAEDVLAVYEEPDHTGQLLLPWFWGKTLYTKPRKRRMTVEQICEELGYDVEIVKEDK